jgi:hypothetical protein
MFTGAHRGGECHPSNGIPQLPPGCRRWYDLKSPLMDSQNVVTPAKAGVQRFVTYLKDRIPAFAGMTRKCLSGLFTNASPLAAISYNSGLNGVVLL